MAAARSVDRVQQGKDGLARRDVGSRGPWVSTRSKVILKDGRKKTAGNVPYADHESLGCGKSRPDRVELQRGSDPFGRDDDLGIVEARRPEPHWRIVAEADGLVWDAQKVPIDRQIVVLVMIGLDRIAPR